MQADPQVTAPLGGILAHWAEGVGLLVLYAGHRLWESRIAHPKVRKERNDELDSRLASIRTAISVSTDSVRGDVTTLGGELRAMKGTVEVVASDVKGLKERELARLETDAQASRRRKR